MSSSTTITNTPNGTHTFTTLLRADITRLEPQYAARRREHSALDVHPTLHDLVARMVDKKRNATSAQRRERGVLLSTLLHAYQASGHRLWETALLGTCMPMVHTVRTRFHGGDPDDREAVFLGDLARTLRTVDPDRDPQILRKVIWRRAKKRLVRSLPREHEWEEVGFSVEADTLSKEEALLEGDDRSHPSDVGRGDLRRLVNRTHAHLSKTERDIVYQRLKKRRQRQAADERGKIQLTVVRRRRGAPSPSVGHGTKNECAGSICPRKTRAGGALG